MRLEELFLSHKDEFEFLEKKVDEEPENIIYRRLMIRSIFSSLEIISSGLIEYAKPIIIPKLLKRISDNKNCHVSGVTHDHFYDYKILFTFCAADDKSYKIDDSGNVVIEKPKICLKDRLLFSVKLLFEARDETINPKTIQGWSALLKAIKIRDRITHPKTMNDLNVSKEDYEIVMETNWWLLRCIWYGKEDRFMKRH